MSDFSTSGQVIEQDITAIVDDLYDRLAVLAGRTVLISGAGGFLGGYFVDVLARLNESFFTDSCQIICVDNFRTGLPERLEHLAGRPYLRLLNHDVTGPMVVDGDLHYIIHAAGIASPTYYRLHPLETIDCNVLGTRNLLDLARQKGAESFLLLSSSEIYGDPDAGFIPTPEEYRGNVSCTGPRACYDESKRLGETYAVVFAQKYQVPAKIVRPFNIYGPGLRIGDKRVIPDFIKNVIDGEPIRILSDGRATRSFCYVEDAMRAMWRVFLSSYNGESFNIGNDQEEITVRGLAEVLGEVAGRPVPVEFAASDDVHYLTDNPNRRCPDLGRIRRTLAYEPRISLREGLRRTIGWHILARKEGKNR